MALITEAVIAHAGDSPGITFKKCDGGKDALGDVLSWNLHRRQLSTSQRALVASRLANMTRCDAGLLGADSAHGLATAKMQLPKVSSVEAAKMLNVSTRIVDQAKAVQREAPELTKKIEAGEITVGQAEREIQRKRDGWVGKHDRFLFLVFFSEETPYPDRRKPSRK